MNNTANLSQSTQIAAVAVAGIMFGIAAKAFVKPKGKVVDPDNTVVKINITPEQYSHILENRDGCIRYETEVGLVALFAIDDEIVTPLTAVPTPIQN